MIVMNPYELLARDLINSQSKNKDERNEAEPFEILDGITYTDILCSISFIVLLALLL